MAVAPVPREARVRRDRLGGAPLDSPPPPDHRPPNLDRRRRLARIWLCVTVAWSLLRILAVRLFFEHYGVNVWVFAAIDLASAIGDGLCIPPLVAAIVDRRWSTARRWGLLAAITYLSPDIYVMWAGHEMPASVYAVLVIVMLFLLITSVLSVRAKIRAGRRAHDAGAPHRAHLDLHPGAAPPAGAHPAPDAAPGASHEAPGSR